MTSRDKMPIPSFGRAAELKLSPTSKSLDAELYKLGRTIKHLQPPGGAETGIFDAFRMPSTEPPTPIRKVKNDFISEVFAPAQMSPPRPKTPMELTTQHKIFSESPPPLTPRRESRTTSSSVFEVDDRIMLPRFYIKINPITGQGGKSNNHEKHQAQRKTRNPITFEGIAPKGVPNRNLQPPGGLSSISLEYIE